MKFANSYIPYGCYWSTPFTKWQGSLSTVHAIELAAQAAKKAMARRDVSPEAIDGIVLGTTVPQRRTLYGGPWLAALVGAEHATGTMVSQACATGARALAAAGAEIEASGERTMLAVTADRCSNSPHIYYPNPMGPGGIGESEDWVMDSFGHDPWARNSMIQTAENVAKQAGITREEQDATTLVRHRQYEDAAADDGAFFQRYMIVPFEVMDARGRKVVATVTGDEGVFPTTEEGLAKLRPVMPDGTVTFGSQTHPADGNAGVVLTTKDRASSMAASGGPTVQLVSYGEARTDKGHMAKATVPAAQRALDAAGIAIGDCKAIKTHNPFAVNDIYFSREMGVAIESFNNYGSSLIFGHPQGPTGMRLTIELVEELAIAGGGYGLFVGCAAGDTSAAVVVKVD